MPTNFPGAIDTLPRPSGSSLMNVAPYQGSTVIDNISDAIEAIETVLGAGIGAALGVFRKIGDVSGTGSSGVMEIAGIPAGYRSLFISFIGRSDTAGSAGTGVRMTFEATPTVGAYNQETLIASGTTVSAAEALGTSDFIFAGFAPSAGGTANLVGGGLFWVPEYANTGAFKNVFGVGAGIINIAAGGLPVRNFVGTVELMTALDRVRLTLAAGNWTTVSRLTVWGLPV